MNFSLNQYKDVWKGLFWFLLMLLACRFTKGYAVILVVLAGVIAISRQKIGFALLCYMFFLVFIQINSSIRGGGAVIGIVGRGAPVVLTVLLALNSIRRRGNNIIPIGGLYLYCLVALFSSVGGWCPPVSYLKLLNFLVFIMGIHVGMRNIQLYPNDLQTLRTGLLVLCVFIVLGSIAVIPFPAIGYSMFIDQQSQWRMIQDAEAFIENYEGIKLYSGVLNHSQSLAPCVVACVVWLFMDMFLVEKKASALHLALIAMAPILLYMTRSRIGLLGFVVALTLVYLFVVPKVQLAPNMRKRLRALFSMVVFMCIVGAVASEIRNESITKWLRKTEDVEVSLSSHEIIDAITSSRRMLVEQNLYDFRQNPIFGKGFQTAQWHEDAYKFGQITFYSAPIEKGVLPLMVLGETGVVGAVVFAMFLIVFYSTCIRKRYLATAISMTVFLTLNMAEASFFSPGGMGGALWVLLIAGGFCIDMNALSYRLISDESLNFENEY